MSRSGDIEIEWGDGTHRFRLAIGQLRELQEKTGQGPGALLQRLSTGGWRVDDAPQILRLGLIGGGMAPIDAARLVRVYAEERPPMESIQPALTVLMAGLFGVPDEPVGKETTPGAAPETSA